MDKGAAETKVVQFNRRKDLGRESTRRYSEEKKNEKSLK